VCSSCADRLWSRVRTVQPSRSTKISGSPATRAVSAARAGNDLLLFAQNAGNGFAAARGVAAALAEGTLDRAAFEAAARRTLDLRSRLR